MADPGERLILPFVCDMIFKSPRIISDPFASHHHIKFPSLDLNSSQARPKRENIMCKSIRFSTFNFYIDSIYRAFLYQHLIFNSSNIARIFSKVVIRVGTKGRRSLFSINPITFSIAFTPAGLPSTNSKLNNSVNL